jgi:hypothetical protein
MDQANVVASSGFGNQDMRVFGQQKKYMNAHPGFRKEAQW